MCFWWNMKDVLYYLLILKETINIERFCNKLNNINHDIDKMRAFTGQENVTSYCGHQRENPNQT